MYLIVKTKLGLGCMLMALVPASVHAASLYMCRSYGGGTFWSSATCSTHNALIERIVNVPDNLPFDQQVQLGEQARSDARRLTAAPAINHTVVTNNAQNTRNECASISERIQYLDSLARQPQSGQTQDQISEERKQLRDRQFRIQCR